VPSSPISSSGLPEHWIARPIGSPAEADDEAATTTDTKPDLAEFGRAEAMLRRWPRWSLRRRRRSSEPAEPPAGEPTELDLVALGADDELAAFEEALSWTDLSLAALDDDTDDAWVPTATVDSHEGPWSILAEELQGDDTAAPDTPDLGPATPLELEDEFWARGTR
jgi:hypothetical protein